MTIKLRRMGWLALSAVLWIGAIDADRVGAQPAGDAAAGHRELVDRYCVTCHNPRLRTADLSLASEDVDLRDVGAHRTGDRI